MFITNAGKPPMTDKEMRAESLQAAVRFARRWALAGIVFASETLILCPRLIKYVKASGLVCGSYGLLNNIPENAKVYITYPSPSGWGKGRLTESFYRYKQMPVLILS